MRRAGEKQSKVFHCIEYGSDEVGMSICTRVIDSRDAGCIRHGSYSEYNDV